MNGAKNDDDEKNRGSTLVWDTSTLRKGIQRQIFSSLMEMSGSQVMIVEQTARELAPLVDPKAPGNGLTALFAEFDDPEPTRHTLVYGWRRTRERWHCARNTGSCCATAANHRS